MLISKSFSSEDWDDLFVVASELLNFMLIMLISFEPALAEMVDAENSVRLYHEIDGTVPR